MKKSNPPRLGKVSRKQVHEILASGQAHLRNDLRTTSSDTMFDFYELDDKRLLLVLLFEEVGVLWESYQVYRTKMQPIEDKLQRQLRNGQMGEGFEDMIISDAKSFETLALQCNKELSGLLSIPPDSLDFSFNSLSVLDKELSKLLKFRNRNDLFDDYVKLLVVYNGEILRRSTGGTWELTEENGKLTSAEIVDARGHTYSPLSTVLEEFVEGSGKFKLKIEVEAELLKHDLFKH